MTKWEKGKQSHIYRIQSGGTAGQRTANAKYPVTDAATIPRGEQTRLLALLSPALAGERDTEQVP
jgi:hypothetical protein